MTCLCNKQENVSDIYYRACWIYKLCRSIRIYENQISGIDQYTTNSIKCFLFVCCSSSSDWQQLIKCLVQLGRCLGPCLISSCQSLDKEQQANRKHLAELVVYADQYISAKIFMEPHFSLDLIFIDPYRSA